MQIIFLGSQRGPVSEELMAKKILRAKTPIN
jgi:hypothetical protein